MNYFPNNSAQIHSKTAIASPQSIPSQPAPIWSGLLVGTLLTVATPTVAATLSPTSAATSWNTPATEGYIAQSMTDSMPGSMPHSMPDSMSNSMTDPTTDPDTSFQRIDQPLGVKALVTIGGLALLAGELWWFLGHRVKSDA